MSENNAFSHIVADVKASLEKMFHDNGNLPIAGKHVFALLSPLFPDDNDDKKKKEVLVQLVDWNTTRPEAAFECLQWKLATGASVVAIRQRHRPNPPFVRFDKP